MWLAIKLHMHSVYPNPPPTPHSQSPPTTQPADTHIDLQGGEKSYIRGEVKTMGRGGSNIRQPSELSVAGSKNKAVWGVGGGTMATVRQKVTAGYHSCTSPGQCLSCGLVGLRCALGEIQDKSKHQGRTMALTLFTKDAFPSAAGEDAHRIPPDTPRPGPAIIPHILSALVAAQHPIPPRYTGGRLCFWPSTSCLLRFPKHL